MNSGGPIDAFSDIFVARFADAPLHSHTASASARDLLFYFLSKKPIKTSSLRIRPFCINVLFGGRFKSDATHKLYKIYSEGNWIEIGEGTPYHIIGASGYGKPILDRTLKYTDPISFALKVGCLAFDSTRISAADVGLPVDIVVFQPDRAKPIRCYRYEAENFKELSSMWQARLRASIDSMDSHWLDPVLDLLKDTP